MLEAAAAVVVASSEQHDDAPATPVPPTSSDVVTMLPPPPRPLPKAKTTTRRPRKVAAETMASVVNAAAASLRSTKKAKPRQQKQPAAYKRRTKPKLVEHLRQSVSGGGLLAGMVDAFSATPVADFASTTQTQWTTTTGGAAVSDNPLYAATFNNVSYCIKQATTNSSLTVDYRTMQAVVNKHQFDFFLCLHHNVQVRPQCANCCPFRQFAHTIILQIDDNNVLPIIQPSLFTQKTGNCFRQLLSTHIKKIYQSTEMTAAEKSDAYCNAHRQLQNIPMKLGDFDKINAGKLSFIRNKILGFPTNGVRMTLTIDCTLPPHYVSVSKTIYDKLQLLTPLVILNRSPSINSKCIYVAELIYHTGPLADCEDAGADDTIHISPFLTEGLHADQDGDELTVFTIQKSPFHNQPSPTLMNAIVELRENSWHYGKRHDLLNRPRYTMTQYHRYLMHYHNDYFLQNSQLWRQLALLPEKPWLYVPPSLPASKSLAKRRFKRPLPPPEVTPKIGGGGSRDKSAAAAVAVVERNSTQERCGMLMDLGCTLLRNDVDWFIKDLIQFTQQAPPQLLTVAEALTGTGIIEAVALSGAKGSAVHIEAFLNNLYKPSPIGFPWRAAASSRKTPNKLGKEPPSTNTQGPIHGLTLPNVSDSQQQRHLSEFKNKIGDNFNNYIDANTQMGINGGRQFNLLYALNSIIIHRNELYINNVKIMSRLMESTLFGPLYFNATTVLYTFMLLLDADEEATDYDDDTDDAVAAEK